MEALITALIAWIPVALFSLICCRSAWLNARSKRVGAMAERLSWLALLATALAIGAWLLTGMNSWNATLADPGVIGLRLDTLSLTMLCVVTFLGAIIVRFSRNYLAGDDNQGYFFKWLLFTLGAVISLVIAPGLVQFYLSWVACSLGLHQLLVYFPDRLGTLLSARKKFAVSRLGDLCLIAAFAGIVHIFGTQDFGKLFAIVSTNPELMAQQAWIGWLIVAGAILKSAQFPFHTWLPDTMGTPTPVSALMHAGIINAGGYLVIRMSPLLVNTSSALSFLAITGTITLAGASLVMLTQTSVKRALAYSTIAQMGFMLLQCGLGAYSLAMLHLVAHSLYKAHAFLSSGSTVATLKRMDPGPARVLLPRSLLLLTLLSLGMVVALARAWDLPIGTKPGLLVLCTVLTMALTQFMSARLQQDQAPLAVGKSFAIALALASLYLGLAQGAFHYFSGVLPNIQTTGLVFQALLACGLATFFLLAISLQQGQSGSPAGTCARALYVHALNGFYLNTLANRMARAAGLVPAGR